MKEGVQFATLTDIITKAWSDKTTKEYKVLKGLKATNPKDFEASIKVAKQGGNVAKVARKELEAKTGKNVVSSLSAKDVFKELPEVKKNPNKITKKN